MKVSVLGVRGREGGAGKQREDDSNRYGRQVYDYISRSDRNHQQAQAQVSSHWLSSKICNASITPAMMTKGNATIPQ